ncbi:MAG: tetratricopeptide repeat protein, partial [Trichodesmium sp. St16_bin2-tuft]|nr:tetratricopeptide repeat protein [Trichodesmium sp. St16_bin2-tuft]
QKTYTGGICWLDCREKNVGLQIISFATSQFSLQIPKEEDLQTQIDFCWHNWAKGDVLIIFDDVVDYEEIANCLPPPELRFKVLITTRQKWLTQSFQRLELEVLDKDAALELLISYVGSARIQGELEEAEALCKDLGFLPLGLELVARYLERKPSLSLAKTRERLGLEHKSLEAFSQDMTAERGVAAAFELSWNELDEDSQELGCLLSLFAAAKIPWNLVEQCLSDVDEEDLEDRRDEKLVNLSLLESVGGSSYWLHPLTRKFFRNKFSESDSIEIMKRSICRAIAKVARKIPDNITEEQVKEVEIDIPHIAEVAENLTEYLSDDDLIVPFTRLGCFYKDLGLYPQGQPWLEKGKEIAERRLDKDNPDVATVYNNLAELYRAQGKYEEAEPLLLQALEINKIALPKNHPSIAISLGNLALLYESQGKYEEAEPLLLQAIEIEKIALPENHPSIATHLNNLAELCRAQGKYEDAEPLYLKAIEIQKIALPENHPSIAISLGSLALLYESQGKYDAAETLLLGALEIEKIALPENHPSIATHLNDLAELY